jgi:hypothetical protein
MPAEEEKKMVNVMTSVPRGLLGKIKAAIDSGQIRTWAYDSEGDFTHTPNQWSCRAWLRPEIGPNGLQLRFLKNRDMPVTTEIYGVYHGRFIEMLLAHFRDQFSTASAN